MQLIHSFSLSPNDYVSTHAHQQVHAPAFCSNCHQAVGLHRHGSYARWVTDLVGLLLQILVARFLCPLCRRTVSYLPDFALSYRLVNARTVEAFFDDDTTGPDVQRWQSLLQNYRRRRDRFAPQVVAAVGPGLGLPPPPPERLWPWIKKACGSLSAATRQLVSAFKITLFKRYQCHQPARC